MLAPIAQASTTIALSTARAQLDNLWKGDVLPLCTRAIANRYPFFRGTSTDVPLDDFAQLFAPNGKIDTFFRNNLMQYVDMARNPWAWQAGTVDLGIPSSVLVQFQRAATIRDAFFPASGQPAVRFDITPGSLDPRASAVLIELDGQTVSYNQGPTRGAQLQWPGTAGPGQARVTFTPVAPGPQPTVSHSGPWAWFRLLEDAGLRGAAREVFSVTFSAGGLTSTWDLRARSTANPFRMADWREFRCPASL